MFKKALAHQSNATPLRSSARRQLVSSVFSQYPALQESVSEASGSGSGADASATGLTEKELGRRLVPDGVRSAAIETSGGIEGVSCYLG